MRKENIAVGGAILAALLCAILVFLIEELKYTPNNVEFSPTPTLSETAADLNSASIEELMTIDTVGEKTAEKIIDFRENERPFETVEDLMLINGFGRAKLENLLGKVYVECEENH